MRGIEMLVFILPRDRSNELLKHCSALGISISVVMHGRGMAGSEVLSVLGIGDTQRDIVMLTVDRERAAGVMSRLGEAMHLERPGAGIAFSIPLSSAASQLGSYELLLGTDNAASGCEG